MSNLIRDVGGIIHRGEQIELDYSLRVECDIDGKPRIGVNPNGLIGSGQAGAAVMHLHNYGAPLPTDGWIPCATTLPECMIVGATFLKVPYDPGGVFPTNLEIYKTSAEDLDNSIAPILIGNPSIYLYGNGFWTEDVIYSWNNLQCQEHTIIMAKQIGSTDVTGIIMTLFYDMPSAPEQEP